MKTMEMQISCMLFDDDQILDVSQNIGSYHCEMIILHRNKIRDKYVFVTVEPCLGCAFHLYNSKVKAVFYGCFNEKSGFQTKFNFYFNNFYGGFHQVKHAKPLKEFFKKKRYLTDF